MAISYPLNFPSGFSFRNVSINPFKAASRVTSPFSLKDQIIEHDGDRWFLEIAWAPLKEDQFRQIEGFLDALNGPIGTFNFSCPYTRTPQGAVGGTPLVKGAGQAGYDVDTDGWPNNITNVLKRGDKINIGTGYHTITKDVSSNGSGEATLDIWPSLRGTISDNQPIVVQNAVMLCRLAGNGWTYTVDEKQMYYVSISAVEAI